MSDIPDSNYTLERSMDIVVPPEPAKSCCKCEAYRSIITEQAEQLARGRKAFDDIRTWGNTLARYCNEGDGKQL